MISGRTTFTCAIQSFLNRFTCRPGPLLRLPNISAPGCSLLYNRFTSRYNKDAFCQLSQVSLQCAGQNASSSEAWTSKTAPHLPTAIRPVLLPLPLAG